MNEEQNNNPNNEQPNALEQMGKEALNAGKQVAKEAGKKVAKQAIKSAVSAIISAITSLITFIITNIAWILPLVVLVAGGLWVVDNFVVDNTSDKVNSMIELYCTVEEDGIHFNKEELLESIEDALKSGEISKEDLGLGFSDDVSSQYIYNYMAASMKTQLPYIETSAKEAQGNIFFYRDLNEDGEIKEEEKLTYKGYEEFSSIMETSNNDEKEELKKYFSLDKDWNICVVKPYKVYVNDVLETYEITEVKIPYKSMVSQYGMPFEFLITLLRVSQNANYVQAVADLENDKSKIELAIFDNIEKTTTEVTTDYNITIRDYMPLYETAESILTGQPDRYSLQTFGPNSYHDHSKRRVEIDTIKANVIRAKTWIIEQETPYEMQKETIGPNTTIETPEDEPEIPLDQTGSRKTNQRTEKTVTVENNEWNKIAGTVTKLTPDQFLGLWKNENGIYIHGEEYHYQPNGREVRYKQPWYTYEEANDIVVEKFASAEGWFYQLLEGNIRTQQHAEIMRYLIGLYKSKKTVDEYRYEEVQTSIYEPPYEFVEGNYLGGSFDVHDESLFITDIDVLKQAFREGYSGNSKLIENAQAFLDLQEQYKVNATFAASVSIIETSAGRAGHAVDGHNNWFNIRSSVTNTGWARYNSAKEGILRFGWQIAEGSYYYKQGKYTVYDIGQTYCPNDAANGYPTQGDDWVANVTAQIERFYSAAGIDISDKLYGPIEGAGGLTGAAGEGYRGIYTSSSGKSYVEYLQYAGPWAQNTFCSGTMKSSGCSITSVAVILSGYGIDLNPEDLRAKYPNSTSIKGLIQSYGLNCKEKTASQTNTNEILQHLRTGNPVIINAGGYWTNTTGHFFTVLDVRGNQVYVSNVGSSTKTGWYDINKVFESNKKVLFIND